MKAQVFATLLGLTLFYSTSTLVLAAEPVVLRVVVLQVENLDAYVQEIERGKALLKRLQSPATIRVWRARFAGPNSGSVVVGIEYPNMAALASDDAKTAASAEFQAWLKNLDKFRKIVSDNLYEELKP